MLPGCRPRRGRSAGVADEPPPGCREARVRSRTWRGCCGGEDRTCRPDARRSLHAKQCSKKRRRARSLKTPVLVAPRRLSQKRCTVVRSRADSVLAERHEHRLCTDRVDLHRCARSQLGHAQEIGPLMGSQHHACRGDAHRPDSVVRGQRRQGPCRQTEVLEQQPPEGELEDRCHVVEPFAVDCGAQALAQLVIDVAVHGFLITKAACTRQKQPGKGWSRS